jgi:dienelactone hydrolase
MRYPVCVVACLLAWATGVFAENATVQSKYNGRTVDVQVELYRPEGPGPFPAVIVLHGCDGIPDARLGRPWAGRLTSLGYLVALPDSFRSRGFANGVCANPMAIARGARVADAYATLRYLQGRSDVVRTKVGLQGHSHGGGAAIDAVTMGFAYPHVGADKPPGFSAVVAFYPYCSFGDSKPVAPVLILMGDKDDLSPPAMCASYVTKANSAPGPSVQIHVYAGATHGYDTLQPRTEIQGQVIEGNPAALADSVTQVQTFFGQWLKP